MFLALFKTVESFLYIISLTRLDFPDPETPVTPVIVPSGILTFMFLRLFSAAPITSKNFPVPLRRVLGIGIDFFPLRYCPVIESGQFLMSSTVPVQTICPPCTPEPGPTSTI